MRSADVFNWLVGLAPSFPAPGPRIRVPAFRPGHEPSRVPCAEDPPDRGVAAPAEEAARLDLVVGIQDLFVFPGPQPNDGDRRTGAPYPHKFTDDVVDVPGWGYAAGCLMVHSAGNTESAKGRFLALATDRLRPPGRGQDGRSVRTGRCRCSGCRPGQSLSPSRPAPQPISSTPCRPSDLSSAMNCSRCSSRSGVSGCGGRRRARWS